MWQYQRNTTLYHSGVMGMKWGHRKSRDNSGYPVRQRWMSSYERNRYAANRVKTVGKNKAIDDELAEYDIKSQVFKRNKNKGAAAVVLTAAVVLNTVPPLVVAAGLAWITYALSVAAHTISKPSNIITANKNIQAIDRLN